MSDIVTVYGKVELTGEEIKERSEQLADEIHNLNLIEQEKKAVMKRYASDIEGCKERILNFKNAVRDGYEYRNVECMIERDFKRRIKRFISMDSGKVIRTEPFNDADRQMQLSDIA